jgi:cation diffusion facilitator CzcD-associated flavoprotein CzcO
MLQRSPTYIVSLPSVDPWLGKLRRVLPARRAGWVVRWRSILRQHLLFRLSKRWPAAIGGRLVGRAARLLPEGYDVATHFTPRYRPWDQRLCLVPDQDLFRAIRAGSAEVVTDHIDTFTETGIRLASGAELPADLVVSATGLRLKIFGGIAISVDGVPVNVADRLVYKAMMLEGVPNFAFAFGYTNASWTLKVDLVGEHLNRLLRYLDRHHYQVFVPTARAGQESADGPGLLDLDAGYVHRAAGQLPRQGVSGPWRTRSDYLADIRALRFGRVSGPDLCFRTGPAGPTSTERPAVVAEPIPAAEGAVPAGGGVIPGELRETV